MKKERKKERKRRTLSRSMKFSMREHRGVSKDSQMTKRELKMSEALYIISKLTFLEFYETRAFPSSERTIKFILYKIPVSFPLHS